MGIRDTVVDGVTGVFPGADSKAPKDAWDSYCKAKWEMSGSSANHLITAYPVLKRRGFTDVSWAEVVATSPSRFRTDSGEIDNRLHIRARARAVKHEIRRAEAAYTETSVEDLIDLAERTPQPPKKRKRRKKKVLTTAEERFMALTAAVYRNLKSAADLVQSGEYDGSAEGDGGYARYWVGQIKYQLNRLDEILPVDTVRKDWDEEFAKLLTTSEEGQS